MGLSIQLVNVIYMANNNFLQTGCRITAADYINLGLHITQYLTMHHA